ncbi:MAG: YfcE family phosphodiesterase [Peptoclostridium sp.]|uniref:metallophosphoesterase family protein n=1 Tax=Peptoclostridium sp. TaxID=1904860 RepID=UPI00139E7491|nr:metallophosphoesterase [Peptoclostridium sp.]MZQ76392.1 YfcE family phosphodiesterase [Peptoclostridium sp.]
MKIGVVGDTHGSESWIEKASKMLEGCDMILHTGDNFRDSVIIHRGTGIDVLAVKGNCDHDDVEEEIIFEASGKRIMLCHGHAYGVKFGMRSLKARAVAEKADVVVFGHTHVALCETEGGTLFFNPGSAARPRMGDMHTIGFLEIQNEAINATITVI